MNLEVIWEISDKRGDMVRLSDLTKWERGYIEGLSCPEFDTDPWVTGPPLDQRRVAIITTAGLQRRGDRPFMEGTADFRVIPGDIATSDLVMSHISVNFDRTGFQQDLNVVFPLDRLNELADEGVIGSVAGFHYSFMGATDPREMEPTARHLAGLLKEDAVNAVLMVPV
jgi:D-proline reductase (dithiol) PrdB